MCATEQNPHISSLFHWPVRAGRKLTKLGKKSNLTCKSLFSSSHTNNVVWHYIQTTKCLLTFPVWLFPSCPLKSGSACSCRSDRDLWHGEYPPPTKEMRGNSRHQHCAWGFVNKPFQWQFLTPLYELNPGVLNTEIKLCFSLKVHEQSGLKIQKLKIILYRKLSLYQIF